MSIVIKVSDEIFEAFPTFRRGVTIAWGVNNRDHSERLGSELDDTVRSFRDSAPDITSDAAYVDWDTAHRSFGSKPKRFPPAHKALAKRIIKGGEIPFISNIVAVMTIISLRHRIPVGGDDASLSGQHLVLRKATGAETFDGLGKGGSTENAGPGEVIYVNENNMVLCRRWNWRNSRRSAILESSSCIIMNTDTIGKLSEEREGSARNELADLLRTYCGARIGTAVLSPQKRGLSFGFMHTDTNADPGLPELKIGGVEG